MAKGSYFQKHKNLIHGGVAQSSIRTVISDTMRNEFESGKVLLMDKPLHWTSFDIVRKIRNAIGIKKVGHAGTLDPLATGLLILCTGKFTKRINEFMAAEKEYTGTIHLGAVTPTYDLESTPENLKPVLGISGENLLQVAEKFTGDIMQVPPIYSAIKKNGVAAYELARRGEGSIMEARPVNVRLFSLELIELPVVHFRIICSTGTYIRSIANDFGAALGCGGYLSSLRRTRIGDQSVNDAANLQDFLNELNKSTAENPGQNG